MLKSLFFSFVVPVISLTAATPAPQEETKVIEVTAPAAAEEVTEIQQTFSILKPDAIENNIIGEISEYYESAGLHVVASKMTKLTPEQAKAFYAEHKDKPFFPKLIEYITSGPVIVQVLEGEDAVAVNRLVMGATDPAKASPGTIRFDFGTDITHNAVHGSDSVKSAEREIAFFFKPSEIFSRQ